MRNGDFLLTGHVQLNTYLYLTVHFVIVRFLAKRLAYVYLSYRFILELVYSRESRSTSPNTASAANLLNRFDPPPPLDSDETPQGSSDEQKLLNTHPHDGNGSTQVHKGNLHFIKFVNRFSF